jgi:hypothetical protein
MNEPNQTTDNAATERAFEEGMMDERQNMIQWLQRIRPIDLYLRDDSSPLAVLFAVRLAVEAGVPDMLPGAATATLAELFLRPPELGPRHAGDPLFQMRLDDITLELWDPVPRLLASAGYHTVGDVARATCAELRRIRGFGAKRLLELRDVLQRCRTDVGALAGAGEGPDISEAG